MMPDYRTEILRDGGGVLHAESNVARGTYGYEMRRLELDGLLQVERLPGVLPWEGRWNYTLTDAGRLAAERASADDA